ncbi:MAG TPA: hypothetical protein VFW71_16420 [Actinomycetota bacterium]|nr:hypothetical protein [Actinomycetota bacterium]
MESWDPREERVSLAFGIASLAWYWADAFLGELTGGYPWALWLTLVLIWPLIGAAAVTTGFHSRRKAKRAGRQSAGGAVAGIIMGLMAIGAFLLFSGPLVLSEIVDHLH